MNPHTLNSRAADPHIVLLGIPTLTALLCVGVLQPAAAQEIRTGVTYVCSGERLSIESCNIRDTSDSSTCMVGHPDHIQANGLMQYTTVTRGALKKLLPTCHQPSAKEIAAADAFQKRQQQLYDANVQKANQQMQAYNQQTQAASQPASYGQPAPPKNAEEREMRRCVSSGRLPSSCTGNSLLGAFSQMLSSILPSAGGATPTAGPTMAGVFQGAGNWRLDFIDGGVLVNCSFLSPNQESYALNLAGGRTVITIDMRPKPLVLTLHADGSITGLGPVTIDGVVASGSAGGSSTPGHTETSQTTTHQTINQNQAGAYSGSQLTNMGGGMYDAATTTTQSTYVAGTSTPAYSTFSPRRATCPAINLSSKGAGVGIQTMQTDLLKTMFGGDKGAPTPAGVRMHGIFAASTGFSLEFFPESVILGCGPDAARAYPYTVVADGNRAVVKIDAPDHPLTLAFRPDGSLDPGTAAAYQVHGRVVTGQDDNDNFTFAPLEQSCNLAVLAPSKTIPSSGGTAATMLAANTSGTLSTPGATLGNATLTIVSGFAVQPGAPNPLAVKPYTLLRDSFSSILEKTGIAVPAGTSPYKALGQVCQAHAPACQQAVDAIKADAASAVRSDSTGSGTFPAVAPGTYYLMITLPYNGHTLTWGQAVQLTPGANTVKLDQSNATPLN
jgi:hypothetical protein